MDLKSAFAPAVSRRLFFRILLGDPRQSSGRVADNLREHRTLRLKAKIGLRSQNFESFGGQIQLLQSFFFSANEASNMAHRRVNKRYYQDTRVCQLLFWATLMEEVVWKFVV